jgi:hypothetical protein
MFQLGKLMEPVPQREQILNPNYVGQTSNPLIIGKLWTGVRSPKFIWAPCVQLYSLAETPQLPTSPSPAFGLIYEDAIG